MCTSRTPKLNPHTVLPLALARALPAALKALLNRALQALLPRPCAACERPAGRAAFCTLCAETLASPHEGAPALAAFAYGGALKDAICQAKFHPDEARARALAPAFAEALSETPELREVDLITFVPLHWRRRISRGFDLPSLLAHALGTALGVPVVETLRNARLDPPLSLASAPAHRRRAVAGRFRARGGKAAGARVLLVDDVVTTGATLRECARVLREAGARSVLPVALAATPGACAEREPQEHEAERRPIR